MLNDRVILEYIWLDSVNEFRSKTRVLSSVVEFNFDFTRVPIWNYDGSSTGQAEGTDSEIFLIPVAMFRDPFRQSDIPAYLVWCDMLDKNKKPLLNYYRHVALGIFEANKHLEPWFGLEQEYFIINPQTNLPLGFEQNKNPDPQGKYYCSVGMGRALGRDVPEIHLEYCLYAGIKICGINAEVAPGQWEYQIGPCVGIDAGDHLWVSRYILNRVAELNGLNISYHPKPLGPNADWNGSGCHTNFSTNLMREPNGIVHINTAITRLSKNHVFHMSSYGNDNKMRMSGIHETSSYDLFTVGRANRGASVRIPNMVLEEGCGYFEDRRPAANCDPYLVTCLILETTTNTNLDIDNASSPIHYDISTFGYVI